MTNTNEQLERQVIELVAADRLDIPISSMSGKLKRMKPKIANNIAFPGNRFYGERVYARVETEDATLKARTMSEAVDSFAKQYPRHGQILKGLIEETRDAREVNMYFGVNPGCRLTSDDYLDVMCALGFSEIQARNLYEPILNASRKISRARDQERSILVG